MAWRDPETDEYFAPLASIRAATPEDAIAEALRRLGGPPAPYGVIRTEARPDAGLEGVLRPADLDAPARGGDFEYHVRIVLRMPADHVPLVDRVRDALRRQPPKVQLRVQEIEAFTDLLWGEVSLFELCVCDFVRVESRGHFGVLAQVHGELRHVAGSREPEPSHPRLLGGSPELETALGSLVEWIERHDGDGCGRAAWAEGASWEELRAKFSSLCRLGAFDEAETVVQRAVDVAIRVFGPENPRVAGILKDFAQEYEGFGQSARADALRARARQIVRKALHG
jgi:Tetratricopeptide repeat